MKTVALQNARLAKILTCNDYDLENNDPSYGLPPMPVMELTMEQEFNYGR